MKLAVITGYVKIPGHPRSDEEYARLGDQLRELREAPVFLIRSDLEECWLHDLARDKDVVHAVADNPKKNTLAYHVVQHQKTAWLLDALEADPSLDVLIWLDYGIFHQPGVTAAIIDDFLRSVRDQPPVSEIMIPGAWERQPHASAESPDWRFCGSSFVISRDLASRFHAAVHAVAAERLKTEGRVTWEVNDWAEVERRNTLPFRWYKANHDQSQFTNYAKGTARNSVVRDTAATTKGLLFRPAFSPGACYVLLDRDEAAYFASHGGAPEAKLIAWADQLVRPDQSFIDVGAHVGSWAQHLAQKCKRVYAFEPQRATAERLRDGIRSAGLSNIDCHEVALGGQGSLDLHVVSVDGGGSTLHHRGELGPELSVERVRAAQLDDFDFTNVGLIKIDAEGAEANILRGARKTLEAHGYPTLLLEAWLHDWYAKERAALITEVETLGYHVQPVANWPEMLLAEHSSRRAAAQAPAREDTHALMHSNTRLFEGTIRTLSRPLFGLVMIVKNEAKRIEEVLASYRPYIDSWTILDTGSSDGTQDLIRKLLAGVPGTLHQEPFVDFATSRNRALELHGISTVFSIMPNGDVLSGGPELRAFLEVHRGDGAGSYRVRIAPGHYYHPLVMRTGAGWRYRWRTHECAMGPNMGPQIPGVVVHRDRGTRTDEEWRARWTRDLDLLNRDRIDDPNDPRPYFYLGQTHECLGQFAQALSFFERRATMGGYFDEVYEAKFRIAKMMEHLERPWSEIQQAYLDAHLHDPRRAEPLHAIAQHWHDRDRHGLTRIFAVPAAELPKPPTDLFLDEEVYQWKAADLAAISSFYTGHKDEGRYFAAEAVLRRPDDERLRANRAFFAQSAGELLGAVTRSIGFIPEAGWNASNPSIYRQNNHLRCIVRTVNYKIVDGRYVTPPEDLVRDAGAYQGWQVIRTRNFLLDLDNDLNTTRVVEMVDVTGQARSRYPVHGFEDARLFYWKGRWRATATVCDFTEDGRREIALLDIDDQGAVVRATPLRGPWSEHAQKNWMPFVDNDSDALKFVYATTPTTIFSLAATFEGPVIEAPAGCSLGHGRLRGGSQGVRIDGGWIFVVHDVAFPGSGRIYLHRIVLLDDQLRVVSMTDPFYFERLGIEFGAGLARIGDQLVASYAVNDGEARFATFDWKTLRRALRTDFVI